MGIRHISAVAVAVSACLLGTASPALAKPSSGITTTGNDISYPQCGSRFPAGQAFGLVGVNGGLANNLNPCLGEDGGGMSTSELFWAWQSTGTSAPGSQPKASLYVNTANPGSGVADWPHDNVDPVTAATITTDPYGPCGGGDNQACAWQYGWDRASQDQAWVSTAAKQVAVAAPSSSYRWWLDVETTNSWETGSSGLANNVADLQGMVAAFVYVNATSGIYSTTTQWGQITGGSTAGNLSGLPDWIPGAQRLSGAESNCAVQGFTGKVAITQYYERPFDGDYAC